MSLRMRVATAFVLALALAASPTVLEQCAVSCDAHPVTADATPSCHHASPPSLHIGSAPSPCGHDHRATTMGAANGRAAGTDLSASSALPPDGTDAIVAARAASHLVPTDSPPPTVSARHGRALPLRI